MTDMTRLDFHHRIPPGETIGLTNPGRVHADPVPRRADILILDQFGNVKQRVGSIASELAQRVNPTPNPKPDLAVREAEFIRVAARYSGGVDPEKVSLRLRCHRGLAGTNRLEDFVLHEGAHFGVDVNPDAPPLFDSDDPTDSDEDTTPDREPDLRTVVTDESPRRLEQPDKYEDELDRWWIEARERRV